MINKENVPYIFIILVNKKDTNKYTITFHYTVHDSMIIMMMMMMMFSSSSLLLLLQSKVVAQCFHCYSLELVARDPMENKTRV